MAEPIPLQPNPPPVRGESRAAGVRAFVASLTPMHCVELFVLANLVFLGLDIFIAHSINAFGAHALHAYARWAEWVPIVFSLGAPVMLLIAMVASRFSPSGRASHAVGLLIGSVSILVGIAGLLFHLNSQFFELRTLKSLVYTAPFVAPLAYTGVGLLLLLDRMVEPDSEDWAGWVILLTAGGFLGNFVLSLADHAQNGFHRWTEWIPVAAAAFATAFLSIPLLMWTESAYFRWCVAVIAINAVVGVLGFAFHIWADLHGPAHGLRENFLYGAPAFAPLLFTNVSLLAALGFWALHRSRTGATAASIALPKAGILSQE